MIRNSIFGDLNLFQNAMFLVQGFGFLFWTKQTFYHLNLLFYRTYTSPDLRKGTILAKCFSFYHARIFLYQQYKKCFGFFISDYAYIEMIGPQISATYPTIHTTYIEYNIRSSNSLCQPLIEDASLILSALIEQTFSIQSKGGC